MTDEDFKYEMLRCISNPVYFYNKYTTQGQEHPITQEVYDQAKDLRIKAILKGRKGKPIYMGEKQKADYE